MQYDYGDAEPAALVLKVRKMDERLRLGPKPLNKTNDVGDDGAERAELILAHFDSLELVDQFADSADPVRVLHLFRLFLYSVVHHQHASFLAATAGPSAVFKAVFKKLADFREQNQNFESRFVAENTLAAPQVSLSVRKTVPFPIPLAVQRRLLLE